jgi:hypothetical protein
MSDLRVISATTALRLLDAAEEELKRPLGHSECLSVLEFDDVPPLVRTETDEANHDDTL